jgi:DNA-binding CsgD family transcriptional regulator
METTTEQQLICKACKSPNFLKVPEQNLFCTCCGTVAKPKSHHRKGQAVIFFDQKAPRAQKQTEVLQLLQDGPLTADEIASKMGITALNVATLLKHFLPKTKKGVVIDPNDPNYDVFLDPATGQYRLADVPVIKPSIERKRKELNSNA